MEENIKQMNLLFNDALSRIQQMSLSKKSYSFRSGIMCLDDILKNFYAGTLVTIGGMSSMGKTTFALNLVNEFAIKQRHPLLFFSLEGTYSSWTNRLLSIVCNIKTTHLSDSRLLGADGLETIDKVTRCIADAPIYLEAKKINHVDRLCEVARQAKKELGIHIIFIDYVQLLNSRDGFSDNRYLDLNYITRRLKELAKELDIPVVILSQLSRHKNDDEGLEARRPRLTDLRDCGTIEEDSDMVILLHRPEFFHIYQDEKGNDLHNMIEISVEKNRFGTTGRCLAKIDKETGIITDVSESHDAHEDLNHGKNNEESTGNLHPKTPGSDFPLPF